MMPPVKFAFRVNWCGSVILRIGFWNEPYGAHTGFYSFRDADSEEAVAFFQGGVR